MVAPEQTRSAASTFRALPQQDPSISITALTAGTSGTNSDANVWGTASGAPDAEVWTEARLSNGAWSRSQTSRTGGNGFYAIPLTYGKGSAGTHTFRVGVRAGGTVTYSDPVQLTRIGVAGRTAGTTAVNANANVWGNVSGASNTEVWTEVRLSSGTWSRSQVGRTGNSGSYALPLTYGRGAGGTTTYRVGTRVDGVSIYSSPVTITRVAVSAATAGSRPVGTNTNVWGTAVGAPNAEVWTEVRLANGNWSRSQVGRTNNTGYYTLPLTYGRNSVGTYTYRVGTRTNTGNVYSAAVTLTRVQDFVPDSRCLTGRVFCASKSQRKIAWMVDGRIVEVADARFGGPNTPTRNGNWTIFRRSKNHVSSIFGTRMPFSQFFSGGQAIHYSDNFAAVGWAGGASAGCINLRDWAAAERFWNYSRMGDRVVVYN